MQDTVAILEGTAAARSFEKHRLETERLRMRVTETGDLVHYIELMTDAEVMKYVGLDQGKVPSAVEIEAIIDGAVKAWHSRGYGRWSIFHRETGEFVGFSGFRCEGGVPELISVVHAKYWGDGYATEAAAAALDYGFSDLGFEVVCSFVRPTNLRARRLLDRVGAEYVGNVDFHGVEGVAYRIRPQREY